MESVIPGPVPVSSTPVNVTGEARRVRWAFPEPVSVPRAFAQHLWDHPDGRAPLEKLVLRVLERGGFEEIRRLYLRYPRAVESVVRRYRGLRRGVRYWIERWRRPRR